MHVNILLELVLLHVERGSYEKGGGSNVYVETSYHNWSHAVRSLKHIFARNVLKACLGVLLLYKLLKSVSSERIHTSYIYGSLFLPADKKALLLSLAILKIYR